ncbi:hypothetical protein CDAR_92901 [Caerostris darwini]|uniref:Uncharacterized protein n=1 Tax=Caerostris darwini TaxID=1538125 RepID=A0AAV4PIU0_9ARAC|nr:hypothetical protein CDAR_92901 [Caerostris darwini]
MLRAKGKLQKRNRFDVGDNFARSIPYRTGWCGLVKEKKRRETDIRQALSADYIGFLNQPNGQIGPSARAVPFMTSFVMSCHRPVTIISRGNMHLD